MWGSRLLVLVLGALPLTACGSSPPPGGDAGGMCTSRLDCDDGTFCNGAEGCDPSSSAADARGCVPGAPPCVAERCNESAGTCAECEDADGDGHEALHCGGDDCDDADPDRFPGAVEVCDGDDEDCDPSTVGDQDNDDDGAIAAACCNGEACGGDCNDGDPAVRPGGTEICDGLDQDCDGALDEGVAAITFGRDDDRDGFGDPDDTVEGCVPPRGYADNTDDCDDSAPSRNPSAPEVCDLLDNDCDDLVDEGDLGLVSYADEDGDGFGDPATGRVEGTCGGMVPPGRVLNSTDCDDTNPAINTGAAEMCNGIDDDCDGAFDGPGEDDDDDGFADATCGGDDCDDEEPTVNPAQMEICDGLNNDCSADHDEEDVDGDGIVAVDTGCEGGPLDGAQRDCDDGDATIFPGAPETCDLIDSDCSGGPDSGPFAPCDLWCDGGECLTATGVRAAGGTTCILTEDPDSNPGEALCVGANATGQRGDGTTEGGNALSAVDGPNFTELWMGGAGAAGVTCGFRFGAVYCWGDNREGQIPGATESVVLRPLRIPDVNECHPGASFMCCVDGATRRLRCHGDDTLQQLAGDGLRVPSAFSRRFAAGADHMCATIDEGSMETACWGRNDHGQVMAEPSASSGVVRGENRTVRVSATHGCTIESRDLLCWGANESGQTTGAVGADVSTPTMAIEEVRTFVLGEGFSCVRPRATARDEELGCFGRNDRSQLIGSTEAGPVAAADVTYFDFMGRVTSLVAGEHHACALIDEQVRCWGDDAEGQLGPRGTGTPTSTPVVVAPPE